MEVQNIPISNIVPSPMNPRKTFVQEDIDELAQSIKSQGLLQPITVRPKGVKYEVVCGERRFRACKQNDNGGKIACIVREMDDSETLDAMICENLNRKDVEPTEEAFAFAKLKERGDTAEDIAIRFGKSVRFVNDRIRLNELIPPLLAMLKKDALALGAAMRLCKLEKPLQEDFYNRVKGREKVNKYEVENFVDNQFCNIQSSQWVKAGNVDYCGSCGTACSKCQFNTKNATCLFYEMNVSDEDARCTKKERFGDKTTSYITEQILAKGDELMKPGETFPQGKAVVVGVYQYGEDFDDRGKKTLDAVKANGYEVVDNCDSVFDGYLSYREGDERLAEKLANREVYKTIEVVVTFNGVRLETGYRRFKKQNTSTVEDAQDAVKANELLGDISANERRRKDKIAEKLQELAKGIDADTLSDAPLTGLDVQLLMVVLLRQCGYDYRRKVLQTDTTGNISVVVDYVLTHSEQFHKVARALLLQKCTDTDVIYSDDSKFVQQQFLRMTKPEECEEIVTTINEKYDAKRAKLVEQLKELGYDENGDKID